MDRVLVARGIVMPFYPMRPIRGHELRNQGSVEEYERDVLKTYDWIAQPKLEGDRACVGVVDGKVYIQNRHGGWYGHPVKNLRDFLKLPNHTVLDGEVFKGNFHPFDCLVSDNKNFMMFPVSEREVLTLKLVEFLGHEWKYGRPSKRWVSRLRDNMPEYGGVVLKRSGSPYVMMGSPNQGDADWMKKCWD